MWSQIANGFMAGFQFIINCGPTVMLPIIITVVGLIFGLKISAAFKSGLTLGIGFAGIKLVLDFMTTNIGPAAKAMVERTHVHLNALDVGWGSIAAVTWASPIIAILIFVILFINIILLILKATHTLDVDIWNYHHMAIVGIMVTLLPKAFYWLLVVLPSWQLSLLKCLTGHNRWSKNFSIFQVFHYQLCRLYHHL